MCNYLTTKTCCFDFTRLLNGTVLESFVRPAVLITDAYNALNNQPSRRQRDQEFLGNCRFFSRLNVYYVFMITYKFSCVSSQ